MKKAVLFILCGLLATSLVSAKKTKVGRLDADKVVDLSGYWNDSDIRIVCESLIKDCIASPRVAKFEEENGHAPVVIVGKIKNDSSERIDTSIVAKRLQTAILNSNVLEFVASADERGELREEKAEQALHSSSDTAKPSDVEEGADFMMTGSVKTQLDTAGKKTLRTYFVYLTLTNITTNRLVWQGENSEIKKLVKQR